MLIAEWEIQNDKIDITRAHILANKEYPKQYNTLVKTTNLAWCSCAALFFETKWVILS
jgi:hypothetical protein